MSTEQQSDQDPVSDDSSQETSGSTKSVKGKATTLPRSRRAAARKKTKAKKKKAPNKSKAAATKKAAKTTRPKRPTKNNDKIKAEFKRQPKKPKTTPNTVLDEPLIKQMFGAWVQRQSIQYVMDSCDVARNTVTKYRKDRNWDKRLARIQKLSQELADYDIANAKAENLIIVRALKRRCANLIEDAPLGEFELKDLPRMLKVCIEMEMLMLDSATEIHEVKISSYKDLLFGALKRKGITGPVVLPGPGAAKRA